MKSLLIAAIAASCLSSAPARAVERATPQQKAQFLALETRLWDTWNKRLRPADVSSFYSQDPDSIFFDLAPMKFQGWAQYQAAASKSLAGGGHATTVINKDFTVMKTGDMAVVAFTFHVDFAQANHAPTGFDGRETDVWVKEKGRWVLGHQHMSVPMRES